MAYLLDASVFIQSRNLQYGFDFCPAFRDRLEQAHAAGRLRDGFFPVPDASVFHPDSRVLYKACNKCFIQMR